MSPSRGAFRPSRPPALSLELIPRLSSPKVRKKDKDIHKSQGGREGGREGGRGEANAYTMKHTQNR